MTPIVVRIQIEPFAIVKSDVEFTELVDAELKGVREGIFAARQLRLEEPGVAIVRTDYDY